MSECTHDCSTCGNSECGSRNGGGIKKEQLQPGARVGKVIAVMSGKGGVGKSLVTSLLASEMQRRGFKTAILDADMTGPSIPQSFGIHENAMGTESYILPSVAKNGTQVMSMNILLQDETEPVVWRGPVIAGMVTQFWTEVLWEDVDYMFVDMPPGTGDVALTVFQSLPLDGIIIVTSPQDLVSMIVSKAVEMAKMMNIPILGLVENYSYVKCPCCGEHFKMFGESHIDEVAAKYNLKVLAKLPMDQNLAAACDRGIVEMFDGDWLEGTADFLETI